MKAEDKPEFVRVLNGLAAIKRVELTAEAYAMWWAAMRDWPLEEFRDAAGYLLKHSEFMPSPFQFEQLRKASDPTPVEAWLIALQHAEGEWRKGGVGVKRIDRTARAMGGYSVIAHANVSKLQFMERQFKETYENLTDAETVREALPQVTARISHGPRQVGQLVQKA